MKRPPALLVIALTCFAAVAVLVACSGSMELPPPAPVPLDQISSVCDSYGNRVYLYRSEPKSLAVVGQDPTCKGATP